MVLGLICAFGAALGYGFSSILEALAARRSQTAQGLDPHLMMGLLRSWQYVTALVLNGLAFLLTVVALRTLPLFVVTSVAASSLAVTALLGSFVLKMPLRLADKIGVGVVLLGLILVASSATEDQHVERHPYVLWGVLIAAGVLAALAVPLARVKGAIGAGILGGLSGLGMAVVSIASRLLPHPITVSSLLTSPATYAIIIGGAISLITYPYALQRGSVTQATAPMVVLQTVVPALIGVFLLGDVTRHGFAWVAAAGFVLAVAGALSLSSHGSVTEEAAQADTAAVPSTSG